MALCLLLLWLLSDAAFVREAAFRALSLCARTVIPALFPFLAISGLLLSLGFGAWLSPSLRGLMCLFHLPGTAGAALLLGLVGGYPTGAKAAADLYRQGDLTRQEAERLLTFCNNSNPVFLVSVLGGIFGGFSAGLALWLIHVLSALLTGLCFSRGGKSAPRQAPLSIIPFHAVSLPSAFVGSVGRAASAMVNVCAFVVLFSVLVSPLSTLEGVLPTALTGMVELFSLTPRLSPGIPCFIVSAACVGWGGVSVLCQTAAALEGSGLSLKPCVLGKICQGLLSGALAAITCLLWPSLAG